MKSRMGAIRGLCLGVVVAGLSAGWERSRPRPRRARCPARTAAAGSRSRRAGSSPPIRPSDFATGHLDLTSSGGPLADATGFVSADLSKAYFRFHVSELPAVDAVGGYVVQFDTNSSTAGWERALRYSPATRTVTVFSSADNAV